MGKLPYQRYLDFVNRKIPRALRNDFKHPLQFSLNPLWPNIFAIYYSLPDYLNVFDVDIEHRKPVHIAREYKWTMKQYEDNVSRAFDPITKSPTGKALLDEIKVSKPHIFILPYNHFMDKVDIFDSITMPIYGVEDLYNVSEETKIDISKFDLPDAYARGMPFYLDTVKGSGTGIGADVMIAYSPEQWLSPSRPKAPGVDPDEVLFHELVHASRQLRGVMLRYPVAGGWGNEEEYLAIILTNLYLSEKGKPLRAGHAGAPRKRHEVKVSAGGASASFYVFDPLPKDYMLMKDPDAFYDKNPDHISMSPRVLMQRFLNEQPDFFRALADLPAGRPKFNPVKQFDQEKKAGKYPGATP